MQAALAAARVQAEEMRSRAVRAEQERDLTVSSVRTPVSDHHNNPRPQR